MSTNHIKYTDNLRQGTDKLNAAIDLAEEAKNTSDQSETNVNAAIDTVNQKVTEIDEIKDDVTDLKIEVLESTSDLLDVKANAITATESANLSATNADNKAQLAQDKVDELSGLNTEIGEAISNAEIATGLAESASIEAETQAGLAGEASSYANIQGKRAADAADAIDGVLEDGSVVLSVNGQTGIVNLSATDVGASPEQEVQDLDNKINTHVAEKIHQDEVHGMRYLDDKFEVFDGEEWIEIKSGEEAALISDFLATSSTDGKVINLSWLNPENPEYLRTEIYASEVDITDAKLDFVQVNSTLIVDGTVTSFDYPTSHGQLIYFKAYTVHNFLGNDKRSKGITVSCLAQDTEAPGAITDFNAIENDEQIILSWTNPTDDFDKVKILYKTSGYPTSATDGTVAYEGSGTSIELNGLINDTIYYFRAFTYDVADNINDDISQKVSATPQEILIYGVKIDTLNSNPESALTYTDDAVGFIPLSVSDGVVNPGSWSDTYPFNEITPIVLKNGVEQYELNPNDFTRKKDGSNSDITTGNDGDVFSRFPKIWWKFERVGTDLFVRIATGKADENYKSLAHTKGGTEYDHVYIGSYTGFTIGGKLRSLSGKTSTTTETIETFRTQAQANGEGYDQLSYYDLLMIQILTLISTKNRDSQSAIGKGYTDGNSTVSQTGGTDKKGMIYGESTGTSQVKILGIENLWGNLYQFVDGLFCDNSFDILIGDNNFNNTGTGYTNYGKGSDVGGFISDVQGGTETGFIIKEGDGSETTQYADGGFLNANRIAAFGGSFGSSGSAGIFFLIVNKTLSYSSDIYSARCCFKK